MPTSTFSESDTRRWLLAGENDWRTRCLCVSRLGRAARTLARIRGSARFGFRQIRTGGTCFAQFWPAGYTLGPKARGLREGLVGTEERWGCG